MSDCLICFDLRYNVLLQDPQEKCGTKPLIDPGSGPHPFCTVHNPFYSDFASFIVISPCVIHKNISEHKM